MTNKEVLAQFIIQCINLHNELKNVHLENWEIYHSMYIKERGWGKVQILLTNS